MYTYCLFIHPDGRQTDHRGADVDGKTVFERARECRPTYTYYYCFYCYTVENTLTQFGHDVFHGRHSFFHLTDDLGQFGFDARYGRPDGQQRFFDDLHDLPYGRFYFVLYVTCKVKTKNQWNEESIGASSPGRIRLFFF